MKGSELIKEIQERANNYFKMEICQATIVPIEVVSELLKDTDYTSDGKLLYRVEGR